MLPPVLLRVLVSVLELALTVVMAVLVVYVTLRALIKANTDFDEDKEILKGNVAVGILVASLLIASANIMHNAFSPVVDAIHLMLAGPAGFSIGGGRFALYALGNLLLAFVIVVGTLSFSLRLFGRLTRTHKTRPGVELEKGNVAVGILLSTVVLIVSFFIGDAVNSLAKAIVPRPSAGRMMIMR